VASGRRRILRPVRPLRHLIIETVALGGLLAKTFGITAPFWFAFVGSALLVAILWRKFDSITHPTAE
jgi:hypothetical protein